VTREMRIYKSLAGTKVAFMREDNEFWVVDAISNWPEHASPDGSEGLRIGREWCFDSIKRQQPEATSHSSAVTVAVEMRRQMSSFWTPTQYGNEFMPLRPGAHGLRPVPRQPNRRA
jgi:hypothetical protein